MPFDRLSKEEARDAMRRLVASYEAQASDLEAADSPYTETEARGQFIDRFLTILGWDVHNESGLPQVQREVVLERTSVEDGASIGRPDYRLRVGGLDRLPVEAKKPSVRLSGSPASALQARAYGWSMSLPASVLTNFAETVIYDTTITPEEGDGPDVAAIPSCRFSASEYVPRFDDLWQRLSYEVVASDDFFDVYAYEEPARGSSPFDRSFLEQFRRWRLLAASDIAVNNPRLGAPEVGRRTQRLLNALLFLRVCEDRNIGRYQALLHSAESDDVLEAFNQADRAFNAGLFDVLGETNVEPPTLLAIIREMYWPRSKFAFGVLRPNTLAAVYEQYLAERVEIQYGRTDSVSPITDTPEGTDPSASRYVAVTLVPKPELTHAGGVVPTPEYIVDAILAQTVDKALTDQPEVPSDLSILDLSCGSGVFLVGALTRLITAAEAAGEEVGIERRAQLVRDHIFGVDIDGAAAEVAKLSLLLAVLGDDVVDPQRSRSLLPNLSRNLVTGNSLISSDFDNLVPTAARVPERRAAVAPLDLDEAFAPVARSGGFALIVGNPPYVRIQTLSEYLPDQLAYLQHPGSRYASSQAYNFDLYLLFIEKAMRLLSPAGRLGMIVPNRFTNGLAGAPIRAQLAPRIERLVHFGQEQIFERRTTYSALVIAGPSTSDPAVFELVSDLASWRSGVPGEVGEVERARLDSGVWPIASAAQAAIFDKMEGAAIAHLGDADWVRIFVGVQTSKDDVFFLSPDESRSTPDLVAFTDTEGEQWSIERSILRPALRDRVLKPYDYRPVPDAHVIFPYSIEPPAAGRVRSKATVHSPEVMKAQYPRALEYLSSKRALLEKRNVSPDPGDCFWAYGRSQSLTELDPPKLIARVLSLSPQYVYDPDGLVVPGGGDGGPYYLLRPQAPCPYSIETLTALLSHPMVDAFVAAHGKAYRGRYIVHRKASLSLVPVPPLAEAEQRRIDEGVREIRDLVVRQRTEADSVVLASLQGRAASVRRDIEAVITSAFGLSAADVASVAG